MTAEVKALYDQLENCTDDNLRLKLLFNIATTLLDFDERRVLETAEQLRTLAEQMDSNVGRAYYHSIQGRVLIKKAQYADSGTAFAKALETALLTPDLFLQAMCYDSLGIVHGYLYEYERALEACFKAFDIYERLGDEGAFRFKVVSCNHIGVTHYIMHDWQQAEQYFSMGLELLGDKDIGGLKPTLQNNLAIVKNIQGDYKASMKIAETALRGYQQLNHKNGIAHASVTIALNYLGMGEPATALTQLMHVLKLLKKVDNKVVLIKALSGLGDVYMGMEAFNEAVEYYQKTLDVALSIGDQHKVCETNLSLGKAHQALNDRHKALAAFDQGIALAQKYRLAPELAQLEKHRLVLLAD